VFKNITVPYEAPFVGVVILFGIGRMEKTENEAGDYNDYSDKNKDPGSKQKSDSIVHCFDEIFHILNSNKSHARLLNL
jgi:hypothetical protein